MMTDMLSVMVVALGSVWVYTLEVALASQRVERGFKRIEEELGRRIIMDEQWKTNQQI